MRVKSVIVSASPANVCALILIGCLSWFVASDTDSGTGGLGKIAVSRPYFNPTLEESVEITIPVKVSGKMTVLILDRDGYLARRLVNDQAVKRGTSQLLWDGHNEEGKVVPDEAYSIKIDLAYAGKSESYFPANARVEEYTVPAKYYDREHGILKYELPKPSRVHIQAGTAEILPNRKTLVDSVPKNIKAHMGEQACRVCHLDEVRGPVLRNIGNREPRGSGSVVETWNGLDESGRIYIPDLPHFVVSIAAWPLPENSIITVGNRAQTFLDNVPSRAGRSLLTILEHPHHHQGLTAMQDISPSLDLKPLNASWDEQQRLWVPEENHLKLQGMLKGKNSAAFATEPGYLQVFTDLDVVQRGKPPATESFSLDLLLDTLKNGTHVIAVNWSSDYGPSAVQSLRILLDRKSANEKEAPHAYR
jgi:hypothetical protein